MGKTKKLTLLSLIIVLFFVISDQVLKIWVRTNMEFHEVIPILGKRFVLYFIENDGMAFGLSIGGEIGQILLPIARIIILTFIIYYLAHLIKKQKASTFVTVIFSLIIAGALGNLIDGMFYGIIFDYAPFMLGRVVDMFYVPLFQMPDWIPGWGGSWFFPAIFNIADCCITVGLFTILFFHKHFFTEK